MASYDLLIKGGTIVDGTGKERFSGDVAVKDGRVAAVGDVDGSADRTIDAAGAIVTPGFTDIHTHYDGQVSWDADLAPSSLHGVTTAVMGSCGVGFAPVHEKDHDRLIELMEGVEDIPGTALSEGISWGWESFTEYMDRIDSFPHAIDFAVQVPHDALRMFVMGERAASDESATEEDVAAMRDHVARALDAGAVGFSTGRTDNHRTSQGLPTPASEAAIRELEGIASAFVGRDKGVLQAVSDFDMNESLDLFDGEFDVIEAMAKAGQRPLSISLMQRDQAPNQWRQILGRVEQATEKGIPMRVQVAPRGIGVLLGLEATFNPFMGFPSYKAIAGLPLAERVAQMRNPELKAKMLTEKSERVSGDGSAIPPIADHFLANIELVAKRLYRLGERPNYEPAPETCLFGVCAATGRSMLDVLYDALLEQDGKALLYFPIYNYTELSLDNVREMLAHPLALPGLSDGGAHVGTVCDASFPTYLMMHWGRDRANGRIPLERLVKMQAHDTSRFAGFMDRGTIAVGQRADLNVIDYDGLQLNHPEMHKDLPAGGQRLLQTATGYAYTLVNGEVVVENGALTGARPGRLARI